MEVIQDLLSAWGKSKSLNVPPNDYPPKSAIANLMRNPGDANVGIPPLDIDRHTVVDAEVSRLRTRKPLHWKIVTLYYMRGFSDPRIARFLKMNRGKVRESRIAAEYYLEARLID